SASPSGRLKGQPFTPGLTPHPSASTNMLDNLLRAEPEDGGFDRRGEGVVLALSTSSGVVKNKVLRG
ncbi:MAG: hypothetical protein P8017_18150, partial [Deltaproteobacteria bacterium]